MYVFTYIVDTLMCIHTVSILDDLPSDVVLSAGDDVPPLLGEGVSTVEVVVAVFEELTMVVGDEVSMKQTHNDKQFNILH